MASEKELRPPQCRQPGSTRDMSDKEMLERIWDELTYVRQKVDEHIKDENALTKELQRDVTLIREEISGHRVKIGLMLAAIGVVITSGFTWVVTHINDLTKM